MKYWIFMANERRGPFTIAELANQPLGQNTPVWRKGMANWMAAREVAELQFVLIQKVIESTNPNAADDQNILRDQLSGVIAAAGRSGGKLIGNFKQIDFKREVWPLNATAAKKLASMPSFWMISLLAGLPLLFVTLQEPKYQLTAFALFFAIIWALIFRHSVVKGATIGWKWRLGCLAFTGTIGLWFLLLLQRWMPAWYLNLTESESAFVRWIGFVLQVGFWEELIKILPVLGLVALFGKGLKNQDVVLLGVFSGLGFAAFENLYYYQSAIAGVMNSAPSGDPVPDQNQIVAGVTNLMLFPLVRSISATFVHAVDSAIFAHFLAAAWAATSKRLPLLLTGWAVAALLHGTYDWLFAIQPALPAIVTVLSFMLLQVYLVGGAAESETVGPAILSEVKPMIIHGPTESITSV